MDSIFEVWFMHPVTGAVQGEVDYVLARTKKEAVKAVKLFNNKRIRKDEFHLLSVKKVEKPGKGDRFISRKKWEKYK